LKKNRNTNIPHIKKKKKKKKKKTKKKKKKKKKEKKNRFNNKLFETLINIDARTAAPIDEHQRKRNNNKILIGYKIIAQILKEKFDWVKF